MKKSILIFTTLLAFAKACFYYPPLSDYKRLDLLGTVFENHRKSLIKHCEQSYIHIMSKQKFIKNAKNAPIWRVFEKPEVCGQTVLPDRSLSIGQPLVKNAKIQKFKMRHF